MRKIVLLLLLTTASLSGCTKSEPGLAPDIRISPEIATRVTGLHFDRGDCIGLTVVKGTEHYLENRALTYDGAAFAAPGLIWYDDTKQSSTLTAYYPYSEAGVPAEFSVATDQRDGYAASDLLGAVREEVRPASTPVAMVFRHLMTQLTAVVDNRSGARITGLFFGGFIPQAEIDLGVPSATVKSDAQPAEVAACCVTEGSAYRAVLVPQRGVLTVRVTLDNGKEFSRSIAEAELAGGYRYDLALTVNALDIELTLSGEIADWQEGGSLGGQETGDTPSTLEYGGSVYSTTEIGGRVWMAENLRYIPEGATVGSGLWYPGGDAQQAGTSGMLYDYAFATGSASAGTEPVRGICPEGWHLPSREELAGWIDAGSETLRCAGFRSIVGETYGNANKGYLLGSSSQNGEFDCLAYVASGAAPSLTRLAVGDFAVSVRCVRD